MATIEHDWRDPPEQPRQPDDPGAEWITLGNGLLMIRMRNIDEAAALARRIKNALANCDEDGTPLAWPSLATMAMVFVGGLISGAIGMAVLITGVEWVR